MNANNNIVYPSIGQSFLLLLYLFLFILVVFPIRALHLPLPEGLDLLVSYLIAIGLTTIIARSKYRQINQEDIFSFQSPKVSFWLIVLLAACILKLGVITPILSWIPMSEALRQSAMRTVGNTELTFFLHTVVAAPILEELLFRGVIARGLAKSNSKATAILISSLLFAVAHLSVFQGIASFLLGLFLGWLFLRSSSILLCIVVHGFNNLMAFSFRFMSADNVNISSTGLTAMEYVISVTIFVSSLVVVALIMQHLSRKLPKT